MWILIFAMYSAPMADNDFASVRSQEFETRDSCEKAKSDFVRNFDTFRSVSAKAICVKK